jgi:hypothetical protein
MVEIKNAGVTPPAETPKAKVTPFEGRTPAYWQLIELEDGTIEGSNDETGETFLGSREEFNARLRG